MGHGCVQVPGCVEGHPCICAMIILFKAMQITVIYAPIIDEKVNLVYISPMWVISQVINYFSTMSADVMTCYITRLSLDLLL